MIFLSPLRPNRPCFFRSISNPQRIQNEAASTLPSGSHFLPPFRSATDDSHASRDPYNDSLSSIRARLAPPRISCFSFHPAHRCLDPVPLLLPLFKPSFLVCSSSVRGCRINFSFFLSFFQTPFFQGCVPPLRCQGVWLVTEYSFLGVCDSSRRKFFSFFFPPPHLSLFGNRSQPPPPPPPPPPPSDVSYSSSSSFSLADTVRPQGLFVKISRFPLRT